MQGKTSHKFFDPSENFILRLYYQKDVLTFMCFFNEVFYSGLYLLNFTTGPTCKPRSLVLNSSIQKSIFIKKSIIHFLAVFSISLFKVLTVIAFPVALAKSGISLLHAYVAAQNMSIIDQNEREEARKRNAAKKPE